MNMTDAEQKLWRALRSRSVGPKFRRQVPLGPYVIDFVCFELKVIVEVDGGQHADSSRDKVRDDYFRMKGYRVQRFWNNDVLKNVDGVLDVILSDPSPGTPETTLRVAPRVPPSPSRGEGSAADTATLDR